MKKVFLIFGASDGIGKETAKILSQNYIVYNASRTPSTVENVTDICCDVSEINAVEDAVDAVHRNENRLDGVIYCSGYSMAAPIEFAREKDFRYLFEVNFFGAVRATKAAVSAMQSNGGRIILLSSLASVFPIAFDSFYSASKAAMDAFSRAANIELNPYHIRVSSIQIGPTSTQFTFKRNVYSPEAVGKYSVPFEKATANLAAMEQNGMLPHASAEKVVELLLQTNPPSVVGSGLKNTVAAVSHKILPIILSDAINRYVYLHD